MAVGPHTEQALAEWGEQSSVCTGADCDQEIVWGYICRKDGTYDKKPHPFDFPTSVKEGNYVLQQHRHNGMPVVAMQRPDTPAEVPRWTSHYATCPNAGDFRA